MSDKEYYPENRLSYWRGPALVSGLALALTSGSCSTAVEQEPLSGDQDGSIGATCNIDNALAFPGALGFGKNTRGGRGGRIVHVTNLNDSGDGSLRWALEDIVVPRIVVFDIEGRINLSSQIKIRKPFVTIAGQTAPGEGIVLSGSRLHIMAKEVIVRGLKSRPGDEFPGDKGRGRDAISIGNGEGDLENIIIDHNSLTWAVDETLSIWGTAKNVTLSNNLIAESLNDSIHIDEGATVKDPHGMAMLIGHKDGEKDSENISVVRNLLASNKERNPLFKGVHDVEYYNNFVSNRGTGNQAFSLSGKSGPVVGNFEANYYDSGKDTDSSNNAIFLQDTQAGSHLYFDQNIIEDHLEASDPAIQAASGRTQYIKDSRPFSPRTEILGVDEVRDFVLANAGARGVHVVLDAVDSRIVDDVRTGDTRIIDSQDEVGGFGVYSFGSSNVKDTDRDGMPDSFEKANASKGLNYQVADDKADPDGDGYTNIEEYINGLIDGFELSSCNGQVPDVGSGEYAIVEAEDMLLSGFSMKTSGTSSSGAHIQSNKSGTASFAFPLEDGTYNLVIQYYDEDDGNSEMSIVVDGDTIDTFRWDGNLGGPLANKNTLTRYEIEAVEVRNGDIIKLIGTADGKEPLRTDFIAFEKIDAASSTPNESVTFEAEDMALSGFKEVSNSAASGGKWVQTKGLGRASLDFPLETGTYDLTIGYFDEEDGESTMSVIVDGITIETFSWDETLGSDLANSSTATTHLAKGIEISNGDLVELSGTSQGSEPLRTDYIVFKQVE